MTKTDDAKPPPPPTLFALLETPLHTQTNKFFHCHWSIFSSYLFSPLWNDEEEEETFLTPLFSYFLSLNLIVVVSTFIMMSRRILSFHMRENQRVRKKERKKSFHSIIWKLMIARLKSFVITYRFATTEPIHKFSSERMRFKAASHRQKWNWRRRRSFW